MSLFQLNVIYLSIISMHNSLKFQRDFDIILYILRHSRGNYSFVKTADTYSNTPERNYTSRNFEPFLSVQNLFLIKRKLKVK